MGRIKIRDILVSEPKKLVSVPPNISILEAARELATHGVGTVVVVSEEGEPIGILSERDVTRAFAEQGANAVNVTVAEQMSAGLITCEESEDPYTAVWLMHAHDIRHLPIMANGRLNAVISSRDILKYLSDHGSPEDQASLWERRHWQLKTR